MKKRLFGLLFLIIVTLSFATQMNVVGEVFSASW
jgi:hypothetical protein